MPIDALLAIASFIDDPKVLSGASALSATGGAAYALLQKLTQDGRFVESRDAGFRQLIVDVKLNLDAVEARLSAIERKELERRTDDDEFVAITANYFRAAYEEPLKERQRMFSFAAASIANLSLSVGELARVQRVLRELDDSDVVELYRLSLVPDSARVNAAGWQGVGESGACVAFKLWQASGAESLEASGCVAIRTPGGGMGETTRTRLEITRTGGLVLSAMRPYIAARTPDVTDLPGHAVSPDFRDANAVEQVIATIPNLRAVLAKARRQGRKRLQYDCPGTIGGLPHDATAKLLFTFPESDKDCLLGALNATTSITQSQTLDALYVWRTYDPSQGTVNFQLWGPHDVLRVLAYEYDAWWA